jgi:hypothetical protein
MERLCNLRVFAPQAEKKSNGKRIGVGERQRRTRQVIEGMVADLQADKLCPPVTPPVLAPVGHGEHREA